MSKLPPNIAVKFRRQIRRCDLRQGLDLVILTCNELLKGESDFESSLEELTKLFAVHMRDVSSREIAFTLRSAVEPQQDWRVPIVELFCLLELAKNRTQKTSPVPELVLGAVAVLPKYEGANIILRELCRKALELEVPSNEPDTELTRETLREQYATLLAQDERPEVIDHSIRQYEQVIAGLGTLREKGVKGAEVAYAKSLNNFAQTLRERTHADPIADRKKAIELFDICLALPARRESLGAYTMTVQSRTAAITELIQYLDNKSEKAELLEASVELATSALERVDKSDGHSPEGYDLTKLRADLWLAWANAKYWLLIITKDLATNTDEIEEELRRHCETAIEYLDELKDILGHEAIPSQHIFSRYLGELSPTMNTEDIESYLDGAVLRLTSEQQAVGSSDTYILRQVMENFKESGVPSPKAWQNLQTLLNALHPLAIGPIPTRQIFVTEASLVEALCTSHTDLAKEHIQSAIEATLKRIDEPIWAETHRRVFASRVRMLATVLLDSNILLSPAQRLWLHDLQNGQAFRGDLDFFGKGKVEHHVDDETIYNEGHWRLDLYRTRVEFDTVANVRYLEELIPLYPEMTAELNTSLAFARIKGNIPTLGQKQTSLITNAEAQASAIRDELAHRLREGNQNTWSPAAGQPNFRTSPEDLEDWLHQHPTTAVFTMSQATADLYFVHDETIRHEPLLRSLEPDQIDELEKALKYYIKALSLFSYGEDAPQPPDVADFDNIFDAFDLSYPPVTTDDARERLDLALEAFFDAFSPLGKAIWQIAQANDLRSLVISSHGKFDPLPLESIPIDSSGAHTLASKLDIIRLYTLDCVETADTEATSEDKQQIFSYIGVNADSSDPLSLAHVIATDEYPATTDLRRDEFDRHAMNARVIRLLTHAHYTPDPQESRFLLGTNPEEIISSPPGMERLNALESQSQRAWFSAMELLPLDLRRCERVELWACESARSLDLYGALLGDDEPIGLAAPFLKAGASRVLGSWWKQPIAPAILIAQYFSREASADTDAFDDARLLAKAVTAFRQALAPDGIFAQAVYEYVESNLAGAEDANKLRREAMWHGWSATFEAFADRPTPDSARHAFSNAYLGGFRSEPQTDILLDGLREDLTGTVDTWLSIWRGPTSWAGWRIIGRDRSVLCSSEELHDD